MSGSSSIEWTDATWSPVTGCDRVSAGCDKCYALTLAKRLKAMGSPKYQADGKPPTSGPGFGLNIHPSALDLPLRWRKPKRVFVNSMSDLFHDDVPDEFIARVWAVMAATPQHTYQILTKRHGRMRAFLRDVCRCGAGHPPGTHLMSAMQWAATGGNPSWVPGLDSDTVAEATRGMTWGKVLPNVWVGCSVEDQKTADLRIPALLETPAAVRWLSCEPLLGPVDLSMYVPARCKTCDGEGVAELVAFGGADVCPDCGGNGFINPISWLVCGGESGPGARPMELDWAQSLVDQCRDAGVPAFVKQLGSRYGKQHKDIVTFPEALRVREYPAGAR